MSVHILGQEPGDVACTEHILDFEGIGMEPKLAKTSLGRAELDRRRLGTFPKLCFVHSDIERFVVDMFALGISSVTGLTLVALLVAATFTR